MPNPNAHNPLVVLPRRKVPQSVITYIWQMLLQMNISATFYVKILTDDYEVSADYELGIHVLPLIPREKLRVTVQVSPTKCYLCRVSSPEMAKKDIHDALTARLTGEVFRIERNNPPPQTQTYVSRKLKISSFGIAFKKLKELKTEIDELLRDKKHALKVLAEICVREKKLLARVNQFPKKIRVS